MTDDPEAPAPESPRFVADDYATIAARIKEIAAETKLPPQAGPIACTACNGLGWIWRDAANNAATCPKCGPQRQANSSLKIALGKANVPYRHV